MISDKEISQIIAEHEKEGMPPEESQAYEMAIELQKRRKMESTLLHDLSRLAIEVNNILVGYSYDHKVRMSEVFNLFCEMLIKPLDGRINFKK